MQQVKMSHGEFKLVMVAPIVSYCTQTGCPKINTKYFKFLIKIFSDFKIDVYCSVFVKIKFYACKFFVRDGLIFYSIKNHTNSLIY